MSIVSKEEYWTTILNDYSQFGQITTEDSEFNSIANDVWNVLENSFIKIDDEESVIKWEEMTGLSGEGLTIFQRKVNILYILTVKNYLPISLFTQAMDRLVGKDNYIITFNEDTQKYEVECYEDYENSASFLNKRLANESVELEIIPLPSGYLAADFLDNGGTLKYIDIDMPLGQNTEASIRVMRLSDNYTACLANYGGTKGYTIFIYALNANGGFLRFDYGDSALYQKIVPNKGEWYKIEKKGRMNYLNGENVQNNTEQSFEPLGTALLFALDPVKYPNICGQQRIAEAIVNNGLTKRHFIPAIDPAGRPCMFDMVSRQAFRNSGSGQFIVGMNMKQARKLLRLPASGGTLTVSLPSNYAEDDGVVNALSMAQENGWVITIQTYETEAGAASTFALRRVWVRKTQNEQGVYVDSDGSRWQVEWCVDIVGSSPEAEGYELFRSVDTAIEYWGLTAWIDPEQEKLLINDFTEND